MLTLDTLIARLEALRQTHGGSTPVRANDGNEFMSFDVFMTDVETVPVVSLDLTSEWDADRTAEDVVAAK